MVQIRSYCPKWTQFPSSGSYLIPDSVTAVRKVRSKCLCFKMSDCGHVHIACCSFSVAFYSPIKIKHRGRQQQRQRCMERWGCFTFLLDLYGNASVQVNPKGTCHNWAAFWGNYMIWLLLKWRCCCYWIHMTHISVKCVHACQLNPATVFTPEVDMAANMNMSHQHKKIGLKIWNWTLRSEMWTIKDFVGWSLYLGNRPTH